MQQYKLVSIYNNLYNCLLTKKCKIDPNYALRVNVKLSERNLYRLFSSVKKNVKLSSSKLQLGVV